MLGPAVGDRERMCLCYCDFAGMSETGDLQLRCGCLVHHDCLVRYIYSQLDDKTVVISSLLKEETYSVECAMIICPFTYANQCEWKTNESKSEDNSRGDTPEKSAGPLNYLSLADLKYLVNYGQTFKEENPDRCEITLLEKDVDKLLGWVQESRDAKGKKSTSSIKAKYDDVMTNSYVRATTKPCPSCQSPGTHYHGHNCHHISPYGGCEHCHVHYCFRCLCTETSNIRYRENRTACLCGNWSNFCLPLNDHDSIKRFLSMKPYPKDTRCGCPICPDCAVGKPCATCPGNCAVCAGQSCPFLSTTLHLFCLTVLIYYPSNWE